MAQPHRPRRTIKLNSMLVPAQPVRMRCPGCMDRVTMEGITASQGDLTFGEPDGPGFNAGQRVCPSVACRTHVFVVYENTANGVELVTSYPVEVLDFDPAGLPENVVAAFREAVTCHANAAWSAAAMMVRKTLEELCADRGAKGKTLFDRLEALKGQVILPPALFDGLDALRLLGNDAAHVESRAYERVGREEVEVGIAVAQEILKATYQMHAIVDRLTALQRQS